MSPFLIALLFGAGLVGGALNAVAGGGTFFVLPALLIAGVAPISANATSTVVLWPAAIGSLVAYRPHVGAVRAWMWLAAPSLAGGLLGAWLLLGTAEVVFVRLMPWLLLGATGLFAFGPRAVARPPTSVGLGASRAALSVRIAIGAGQALVGIYGGYFGGGMGIVMLALYSLTGVPSVHALNGLKALQIVCINGVAVATFVARGAVDWPAAVAMVGGSVLGGWLGARTAQRVDVGKVRNFIVAVALGLTGWLFWRGYGAS
ncbi:MAG: sulfite exporter TauE/SafE family protein [Myxococcales bacterium]|nr:sulfite exporter TauE/SafE family protein [Myxococcales bacterium]